MVVLFPALASIGSIKSSFSIKQVIENCSGESLEILAEAINSKFIKKQSTNQSSQDDLVR